MLQLPANQKAQEFRGGRPHAEKALAELDQRQPFVLEVAHDLAGEGPVVSQLRDHEARGKRQNLRLDEFEIRGVALGRYQQTLVAPDRVRACDRVATAGK